MALDHLVLKHAIALAAVDDDGIHPSGRQGAHPLPVRRAGADGRGHQQLFVQRVLRGVGELHVLPEMP